ncbi:hypothetical protein [Blautia sp. MSJ-9]|nr:hypothetical protein [Blautia sp. MSJ-9]
MTNRAGTFVSNLSGEMAYESFLTPMFSKNIDLNQKNRLLE